MFSLRREGPSESSPFQGLPELLQELPAGWNVSGNYYIILLLLWVANLIPVTLTSSPDNGT